MKMVAAMGLMLGCASFLPDMLTDQAAPYANPLVSSGFAWGITALIAGTRFKRPKSAALAGAGVLMIATVNYYALILFVNRRWEPGANEMPTEAYCGLCSIARSLTLWLAGSACGGAIMGVLGGRIQNARPRPGSAATGLAAGFLAGEGLFTLIRVRSIWVSPLSSFETARRVLH